MSLKFLDAVAFGYQGQSLRAVTLEIDSDRASEFMFNVSRDFQRMMEADGGEIRNIIGLGQVFYYRGINFRVVEAIKN